MGRVEIVEQQEGTSGEWRPWEPPTWLVALGLCLALAVGLARASDVHDPRLGREPAPTPCVPHIAPQAHDVNYLWTWCP